jgi:hypothetical protein
MSITRIATATSSSNFASFDFQSISSAYTDLMIVLSASEVPGATAYERINIGLNGEALTDPQSDVIWGRGYAEGTTTVTADRIGVMNIGWIPSTSSTEFATIYIYLPNYAGTQSTRQVWARAAGGRVATGSGANAYGWSAGLKNSSTAISRITIGTQTGSSLRAYSYASLYGITKGGSGSVTAS